MTCIILAHINNLASPGTYNTKLNKILKFNNNPPVIMAERAPFQKIFSLAASATVNANFGMNEKT